MWRHHGAANSFTHIIPFSRRKSCLALFRRFLILLEFVLSTHYTSRASTPFSIAPRGPATSNISTINKSKFISAGIFTCTLKKLATAKEHSVPVCQFFKTACVCDGLTYINGTKTFFTAVLIITVAHNKLAKSFI